MGACGSSVEESQDDFDERQLSNAINQTLESAYEDDSKMIKILLLGAGECGKSTILKQMKILHLNGFSEAEKLERVGDVLKNTLESIQAIARASLSFGVPLSPGNDEHAEILATCNPERPDLSLLPHIISLWNDKAMDQVYDRGNEYQLLDSAKYFLDDAERIFQPDYIPTTQDILRSRIPTCGVHETDFWVERKSDSKGVLSMRTSRGGGTNGNPTADDTGMQIGHSVKKKKKKKKKKKLKKSEMLHFKMFDVGGQRGQRQKWIHIFDNVHAILYVASLSEYDQVLAEEHTRNRLVESLNLFEGIISLPWFKDTAIILFLNKNDLFTEKIKTRDLGLYFPHYVDGCDYDSALFFIKDMFVEKNTDPKKIIYAHVTDATDTTQIKFVWQCTKHIILQENLTRAGLMM